MLCAQNNNKSIFRYPAFVSLALFRILSAFMGFRTACNIFHFLQLTDFDWHLIVYKQCVLTQAFRTRIGFQETSNLSGLLASEKQNHHNREITRQRPAILSISQPQRTVGPEDFVQCTDDLLIYVSLMQSVFKVGSLTHQKQLQYQRRK